MLREIKQIIKKNNLSDEYIIRLDKTMQEVWDVLGKRLSEYGKQENTEKMDELLDDLKVLNGLISENVNWEENKSGKILGKHDNKVQTHNMEDVACEIIEVYLEYKGLTAYAEYHNKNKVVLKKGSQINKDEAHYIKDKHNIYSARIIIEEDLSDDNGQYYVLSEDIEYTSPSTASMVVLGRYSNGWDEWKVVGTNISLNEYTGRKSGGKNGK